MAAVKKKKKNFMELLENISAYPEAWTAVGSVIAGDEFLVKVTLDECFEDCALLIQSIEEIGLPVYWEYVQGKGKYQDIVISIGEED